jgi:hypothetical protein
MTVQNGTSLDYITKGFKICHVSKNTNGTDDDVLQDEDLEQNSSSDESDWLNK